MVTPVTRDMTEAATAQNDADESAGESEHHRLSEKLQRDVMLLCADRFAQADLSRALRDGREHHVHDADAADEERDRGDRGEERSERARDARCGGNDARLVQHGKVGRLVGRNIMPLIQKRSDVVLHLRHRLWVDASTSTSVRYALLPKR